MTNAFLHIITKGMYYKSCNRVEPIKETLPTSSPSHSLSLEHLPQEVLLKVFSYLDPQDLCHLSQTHPSFSELAFDGSLWSSLHPVRWADGHWKFFSALFGTKDEVSKSSFYFLELSFFMFRYMLHIRFQTLVLNLIVILFTNGRYSYTCSL